MDSMRVHDFAFVPEKEPTEEATEVSLPANANVNMASFHSSQNNNVHIQEPTREELQLTAEMYMKKLMKINWVPEVISFDDDASSMISVVSNTP